jgi:hypothetical protein
MRQEKVYSYCESKTCQVYSINLLHGFRIIIKSYWYLETMEDLKANSRFTSVSFSLHVAH